MDKEFETLESLINKTGSFKQALTELKAIKEAKPSEALDKLETIVAFLGLTGCLDSNKGDLSSDLYIIEQYILKAQEQEKVLEIIKEKDVDMYSLRRCETVEDYNTRFTIDEYQRLTEEEFDTLKRWSNEK